MKPFLFAWALLLGLTASAQTPRHHNHRHTPKTYDTREAWLGRAAELREHILVSAGLAPLPDKTPLHPRLSDPVERDGYTVQSVVLETYPGFYLFGNLYRPAEGDGPFPAVLTAHGHWDTGRFYDGEHASIPARALSLARQGFVVFAYSMVGYNETAELLPHRTDRPEFQLWGFSIAGLQLWNSLRALDYLAALPDVDADRIGMTGASGGGTQTFLLTGVDDRIKVAVPVNMISAHMQGGCVCENAPLLRLTADNMDIGALAAPRPLLMVSTTGDWTVNTPSVEYPAVRDIYELFFAEDRVENVHLDFPHNYNRDSREAAYAWFGRWLQGRTDAPKEQPHEVPTPAVLAADLPDDAKAFDALFTDFKARAEAQVQTARPDDWTGLFAYRDRFGPTLRHTIEAEATPAPQNLEEVAPASRTRADRGVLIVYDDAHADAAQALARTHSDAGRVAVLLRPYPEAETFVVPDSVHYWTTYNLSPHARQVAEIRKAAQTLLARPDITGIDLVGLGEAAPKTLLARAFVSDVGATRLDFAGEAMDGDDAFLRLLDIPLVRRAGDLRTAAALIAPAPLTVERLPDGALRDWMQDVYEAAGASELLTFE